VAGSWLAVHESRSGSADDGTRSGEIALDRAAAFQVPANLLSILVTMLQVPSKAFQIWRRRCAVPRSGSESCRGAPESGEAVLDLATALQRRSDL
jgi:hypothetical protein